MTTDEHDLRVRLAEQGGRLAAWKPLIDEHYEFIRRFDGRSPLAHAQYFIDENRKLRGETRWLKQELLTLVKKIDLHLKETRSANLGNDWASTLKEPDDLTIVKAVERGRAVGLGTIKYKPEGEEDGLPSSRTTGME